MGSRLLRKEAADFRFDFSEGYLSFNGIIQRFTND